MQEVAVIFCCLLAELYSEDLDRKQLWERIGNGIVVAVAKAGQDWELFVNEAIKFVKADAGVVARNKGLSNWIEEMTKKPEEWHEQFLRTCESKHMIICVKARMLWNSQKKPKEKPWSEDVFEDDLEGLK